MFHADSAVCQRFTKVFGWSCHGDVVMLLLPCHLQKPLGEPVWRQVLLFHLDYKDPQVVQRAAAALAE
jgi:hypothetical protein